MSKRESKPIYIKNAKISIELFQQICHCFSLDYTASYTANKVGLSRQTINTYYKIFRNYLCSYYDLFEDSTCTIYGIKLHNQYCYSLKKEKNYFFLNQNNPSLNKVKIFLNQHPLEKFFEQKKSNALRIGFNKFKQEYFLFAYFNCDDGLNSYIQQRLKKFRGINKNTTELYFCESLYRFNNTQEDLYQHLVCSFTLL